MFGNCLWYQLSSTHNLNQIIFNFHKLFGTQPHKAHITIEYDIISIKQGKFIKLNRMDFIHYNRIIY
jgi:hypothetical protein